MKFENPFESLPDEKLLRTTIKVSREVHGDLFKVHPTSGVLQTTINILLIKIYAELIRHDLRCYDPERYKHAIANCIIVFPGAAGWDELNLLHGIPGGPPPAGGQSSSAAEASVRNDAGGTGLVAQPPTGSSGLPDAGQPPSDNSRKAKGKGRKGTSK